MTNEPNIIINGKQLSEGQAMTLRVALESFATDLVMEVDALGDDAHGRDMARLYQANIRAIRSLMSGTAVEDPSKPQNETGGPR